MPRIIDFVERLFVILAAAPFFIAFARVLPNNPHVILLMASELLVVVLILIRRPGHVATTPYAFTVGFLGSWLPLLIRPSPGVELLSPLAASVLMIGGLCLNIAAKLFLNRSFGIVAANRGVKSGGPYGLVRHPMYLGYVITQSGFLLTNLNVQNLLLYTLAWTFQILRIREEEKILMLDEAYQRYSERVGYRLVPGVY